MVFASAWQCRIWCSMVSSCFSQCRQTLLGSIPILNWCCLAHECHVLALFNRACGSLFSSPFLFFGRFRKSRLFGSFSKWLDFIFLARYLLSFSCSARFRCSLNEDTNES